MHGLLGHSSSVGSNAPVRHMVAEACAKFWSIKLALTTKALSLPTRLNRLRAEVFPALTEGCTARSSALLDPGGQ